jgi:alginate O-acetyltransferase complex protein AlgI
MRTYDHPVFHVILPEWWRYKAQMPPGVLFYIFPALLAHFVPQRWLRDYLLVTSALLIFLTYGYGFTLAMAGTVAVAYALCSWARRGIQRSPNSARRYLWTGWIIANAIYFSMFALPVYRMLPEASTLDVMLLCGPAFSFLRFLSLYTDICRQKDIGLFDLKHVALYLIFAPTFRLGPFMSYADINRQIDSSESHRSKESILEGLKLIGWGLALLLSITLWIDEWLVDRYHEKTFLMVHAIFDHAQSLKPYEAWLAVYAIVIRCYFGFLGYVSLSRGVAKIMGMELPINFDWPYLASNPASLWRRWNITTGEWLKNYIYIPLGGRDSRVAGTFGVFIYCFLWHQPTMNFLLFGILQAVGLLAYLYGKKWMDAQSPDFPLTRFRRRYSITFYFLCWLVTFHYFSISHLVIFDQKHLGWEMLKRMFGC